MSYWVEPGARFEHIRLNRLIVVVAAQSTLPPTYHGMVKYPYTSMPPSRVRPAAPPNTECRSQRERDEERTKAVQRFILWAKNARPAQRDLPLKDPRKEIFNFITTPTQHYGTTVLEQNRRSGRLFQHGAQLRRRRT